MRRKNIYFIFFLLCMILYLPASFVRSPIHPDEVRSIHVAQNMQSWESCLFPTYMGEPYYEKPPLYFWLLKFFLRFSQYNFLFLPVLFNALIAWGIISFNYWFFEKQGKPEIGRYASFFLAATGLFYAMTVVLRMDLLFMFFIILAAGFFWLAVKDDKPKYLFLAALSGFLAVFTKGALGIIFPLLIELGIGILSKDKKIIKKALAVNIFSAALVFTWLLIFSRMNPQYFQKMFFEQTFARGVGDADNPSVRIRSFLFYIPFVFLFFLPWSFFGAGYFFTLKGRKKETWEKLYLFWFLTGFLVLSLFSSKMSMYLLLLSVPFCGLVAGFFVEGAEKLKRKLMFVTVGFFLFCWIGGFIYSKLTNEFIPDFAPWILAIFCAMLIMVIKRPAARQARNFFILWLLILQISNFKGLAMAARDSELKHIVEKLNSLPVDFDAVYSTDKMHLLLPAYREFKKASFYWQSRTCPPSNCILLSKEIDTDCDYEKIAKVGVNFFYYKTK